MKERKIGIFGGSFNPIHIAHINLIKAILSKNIIDELWIMPCKKHAFSKSLASSKDRINMINLAINSINNAKICKIELKLKGKSYMINTIKKLKSLYNYKFYLIVGSDITHEITKWHNYKGLFKETEFIIFKRPGYSIKKVKNMKIYYIVKKHVGSISSTQIRENIKQGKSLKNLLPSNIQEHINKKGLYK